MPNDSIATKLQELFDLFKSGALNKEEYDQLKSEIISNIAGQQPKETESSIDSANKLEETDITFSEKMPI